MTDARWQQKASALSAAWTARFGSAPSAATIAVCLGVAQGETACGDSWPGTHNWGAVQLRSLHANELAALAGIAPEPSHVPAAQAALAAAVRAGTLPAEPAGQLHADSHPGPVWYWVFFRTFASDTAGAAYWLSVERTPDEVAAMQSGDAHALAAAMRAAHYYEGRHDNRTAEGQEQNIEDYTAMIEKSVPAILAAIDADDLPPADGSADDWFD